MVFPLVERCRDGCRTSLLIAGVVLVPTIFHNLLPPCHPYITIHFMEMIFPLVIITSADTPMIKTLMTDRTPPIIESLLLPAPEREPNDAHKWGINLTMILKIVNVYNKNKNSSYSHE